MNAKKIINWILYGNNEEIKMPTKWENPFRAYPTAEEILEAKRLTAERN